ncbi:MAG: hypothetical protein ACI8Z1_001933 [Candidatus Azotimanducaceae bacterium]|jgi:hypothetical protein
MISLPATRLDRHQFRMIPSLSKKAEPKCVATLLIAIEVDADIHVVAPEIQRVDLLPILRTLQAKPEPAFFVPVTLADPGRVAPNKYSVCQV